jgi:hypothetical protein
LNKGPCHDENCYPRGQGSLSTGVRPLNIAVSSSTTFRPRALTFAHAAGLLLLAHTGRIRMFGASASNLMERYLDSAIGALSETQKK